MSADSPGEFSARYHQCLEMRGSPIGHCCCTHVISHSILGGKFKGVIWGLMWDSHDGSANSQANRGPEISDEAAWIFELSGSLMRCRGRYSLPERGDDGHVTSIHARLDGNQSPSFMLAQRGLEFWKAQKTHGCSVFPTPTPMSIAYPTCLPTPVVSSRVDISPRPTAQQTQPKRIHSR